MPSRTDDPSRALNKRRGRRFTESHYEAARRHVERRTESRIGRRLTFEEHAAISEAIRAGQATDDVPILYFVQRHKDMTFWDVTLPAGETLYVVWHEKKKILLTVLPAECRQPPERMRRPR
jgi:hypothetical protein